MRIEPRDLLLAAVMVISAFLLTTQWLEKTAYARGDAIIVIAAMVLMASLAALMLSIEVRLRRLEERLERTERALRVNIQSVGEEVERKLTVTRRAIESADERRSVAVR